MGHYLSEMPEEIRTSHQRSTPKRSRRRKATATDKGRQLARAIIAARLVVAALEKLLEMEE